VPHRLPPLNALRAFEAAAHLGNFPAAARELNVTAGAMSRQVRRLEDYCSTAYSRFKEFTKHYWATTTHADLDSCTDDLMVALGASPARMRRGGSPRIAAR